MLFFFTVRRKTQKIRCAMYCVIFSVYVRPIIHFICLNALVKCRRTRRRQRRRVWNVRAEWMLEMSLNTESWEKNIRNRIRGDFIHIIWRNASPFHVVQPLAELRRPTKNHYSIAFSHAVLSSACSFSIEFGDSAGFVAFGRPVDHQLLCSARQEANRRRSRQSSLVLMSRKRSRKLRIPSSSQLAASLKGIRLPDVECARRMKSLRRWSNFVFDNEKNSVRTPCDSRHRSHHTLGTFARESQLTNEKKERMPRKSECFTRMLSLGVIEKCGMFKFESIIVGSKGTKQKNRGKIVEQTNKIVSINRCWLDDFQQRTRNQFKCQANELNEHNNRWNERRKNA